jgi:hypothetical protein
VNSLQRRLTKQKEVAGTKHMTTQMNKLAVGLTAVAIGFGMAASANAVTLKISPATAPGLQNKVTFGYNAGDGNFNYTAKVVMFKAVNTANASDWFYTFCTDIGVGLKFGVPYNYNPVPFAGATGVIPPAWDANGIQFAAQLYKNNLNSAIADPTGVNGTALQLAIWEALYDTAAGYSLAGGDFKASGNAAAVAQATSYLSQLANLPTPNFPGSWYQPVPEDKQGLIRVPEGGATLALLGIGFMSLAGLRRKLS